MFSWKGHSIRRFRRLPFQTLAKTQEFIRRSTKENLWESLQRHGVVNVGRHTYGVPQVFIWDHETHLTIGSFCSIAEDVVIALGGEHRSEWKTTYPFSSFPDKWPSAKKVLGHPKSKGHIVIGNDVWIGYGALILSGVTIGDGAVIGAASIVTKDVEPYAIVAGNPARLIRYRFDKQTIHKLQIEKWWEWTDGEIGAQIQALMAEPDLD